jgi:hypothetical protein
MLYLTHNLINCQLLTYPILSSKCILKCSKLGVRRAPYAYLRHSTMRPAESCVHRHLFNERTCDLSTSRYYDGQLKRRLNLNLDEETRVPRYHCRSRVRSDFKSCGCEVGVRECSNAEFTTTSTEIRSCQ